MDRRLVEHEQPARPGRRPARAAPAAARRARARGRRDPGGGRRRPARSRRRSRPGRPAGAPRSGCLVRQPARARRPPRPASRTAAPPAAARPRAGGPPATGRASRWAIPPSSTRPRGRAGACRRATRSSVDLPAPFGPTSATRSPCSIASVTSRRIARPRSSTVTPSAGQRDAPAHSSYPVRARRRSSEEERRPDDRGDDADRDAAEQPRDEVGEAEEARPEQIAESGRTRRAFGPTSRRTTCGTTSPTNPISPATATAGGGHQRGERRAGSRARAGRRRRGAPPPPRRAGSR